MTDLKGADVGSTRGGDYQPPKLTPLGNARDLLAGDNGSIADTQAPFFLPFKPSEPGG